MPKVPGHSRNLHNISIDPGITGSGVAVWHASSWKEPNGLVAVYNLYPGKCIFWEEKMEAVCQKLEAIFDAYGPIGHVFIELPHYMAGDGGHAFASDGGLTKLAACVGAFCHLAWSRGAKVTTYPVRQWKGELPKEVVISRIKRIMETEHVRPAKHAWDAIGIGLYAKGLFKPEGAKNGQDRLDRVHRELGRLPEMSSRSIGGQARDRRTSRRGSH